IDQDVQTIQNLGASTMVTQAMNQGDANVGAGLYTGTSLTGSLGLDPITDPDRALEVVVEGFDERFNAKWYPSYGFASTY
ncbi:osmoprotectant ABC transporter substrate-binding protein, partial [Salmonella enterica subsp. enterica serovar Typhimurium]